MDDRLKRLNDIGQSIWLDYIQRSMIESGELGELIRSGVSGLTSNPTIFDKVISGSSDYDDEIKALAVQGKDSHEIYEELSLSDIAQACALLKPVFERSAGRDGFVSIEVSPHLAYDADKTLIEVQRLHGLIDCANLLVKVPGTPAGIEAFEKAIKGGFSVNVTLLFSITNYESVARAYIRGLQARNDAGEDISRIASVASFFLSRIDTQVDRLIDQRSEDLDGSGVQGLRGRAAISVAKIVYQRFKHIFSGSEWEALAEAGAHVQKPLWASTGTKDPAYSDVKYVEPLIGPETINTLPLTTIQALIDHGVIENTVEANQAQAEEMLDALADQDISLEAITTDLQIEGVGLFSASFDKLLETIETKRGKILEDSQGG